MIQQPISLADVIATIGQPRRRHPVVRIGQRAEIPAHVRAAVWFRDRGACELCGTREVVNNGPWHLDHIKPWSAGGPDTTDNLRLLCEAHNVERSNYADPTEDRPRRPATWWCIHCYSDRMEHRWQYSPNGVPLTCPIHESFSCRVIRGVERTRIKTGEWPTWHEREPIDLDGPLAIAYCAHCDAPALTGYPL